MPKQNQANTPQTSEAQTNEEDQVSETQAQALTTLAELTQQLREFEEGLVQGHFDNHQLNDLLALIKQCNSRLNHAQPLQANNTERLLKHFNFAEAGHNPKGILPFSPVSGTYNALAPDIDIQFEAETGQIIAKVELGRRYEGPPGMVHGGVISAIFDQVLAMCATCNQFAGPTAYLNIQYQAPTPLYQELVFRCKISKQDGRKITVTGECLQGDTLCCSAEGLFIHYSR